MKQTAQADATTSRAGKNRRTGHFSPEGGASRGNSHGREDETKHSSDSSPETTPTAPAQTAFEEDLTPREQEVLVLIGYGKSTKETAVALGISFKWYGSPKIGNRTIHDYGELGRAFPYPSHTTFGTREKLPYLARQK